MTADHAKRQAIRQLTNDGQYPVSEMGVNDLDHEALEEAGWILHEPNNPEERDFYEHESGLRLAIHDDGLQLENTPITAYATSNEILARFDNEEDRDHWVKTAPLVREAVPSTRYSNEDVDRLVTLVEHGLAQWTDVHDPDARVTYEIPDLVIPAQVSSLPPAQAKAYWLCDHEDGPNLNQREAAWLLQTSQGSISNQLKRAREKL